PPEGQGHNVVSLIEGVWPRLTERRDASHHETWVQYRKRVVIEAARIHYAGSLALDDEIGALCQFSQNALASLSIEVDGYAALAGVEIDELQAVLNVGAVVEEGALTSTGRACDRFDQNNVRAQVRELLATVLSGQPRQIE